jgi:hypothetical protein
MYDNMEPMKKLKNESDYCCPICNSALMIEWGNGVHKGDQAFGGFLTCQAPASRCPTPENVRGHGNGRSEASILAAAYKIIMAKYTGANIDLSDDQPVEPAAELPEAPVAIKSKPSKKSKATLPVVAIEVNDEDAL